AAIEEAVCTFRPNLPRGECWSSRLQSHCGVSEFPLCKQEERKVAPLRRRKVVLLTPMLNMKQPKPARDDRRLTCMLSMKPRKHKSERYTNLRRPMRWQSILAWQVKPTQKRNLNLNPKSSGPGRCSEQWKFGE